MRKKQKYQFFDDLKEVGDTATWSKVSDQASIRAVARNKGIMLVSVMKTLDDKNKDNLTITRTK